MKMSTKVFQESNSWEDTGGDLNWASTKASKPANKNKKNKRAEKRNHSANTVDSEPGKYVKAPKYYGLEDPDKDQHKSPPVDGKNNRKRKHAEVNINKNEESGETVKNKKKLKHSAPKESGSDSYADQLRENLKGSRFRFLNEQMYKQSSKESVDLYKEDKEAFKAYHEGYRHQVEKWPMNPLDRIIKNMKKLPKNHVVVDMGCGDGRLAQSIAQKVYSIDLVSTVEGVIESDMAHTPLGKQSAHIIVYCLSLMGTNLKDFFIEANRLLKMNGLVKIAEISSRFDDINTFVDFVQKCGFELVNKDLSHDLFYFINFKKTHDVNNFNKNIPNYSLKPCLYKKR